MHPYNKIFLRKGCYKPTSFLLKHLGIVVIRNRYPRQNFIISLRKTHLPRVHDFQHQVVLILL